MSDGAKKRGRLRLIAVAAVFLVLWVVAQQTGLAEKVDIDIIKSAIEGAGAWGVVLFVVAFAVGLLLHFPGMAFVAAGILAYGRLTGFAVVWFAAVLSVAVSFAVVRAVGGKALAGIDRPFVKRMLARLEEKPITTVVLLRSVLWLAPAVNYGLALTTLRFRDYVIGSAIGLVPPIAAAAFFFDWLLALVRA